MTKGFYVFSEARGSRPLAARLERRMLLRLFEKEIYPQRRVVVDFLTHGVTRERLESQVRENNGYHVVHWSGHGHLNLLELAKPGGASDHLSGDELLDLFKKAGGFIPRLVFLSACHSGDILRVKDWNDFFAIAQGKDANLKEGSPSGDKKKFARGAAWIHRNSFTRYFEAECHRWSRCVMPWAMSTPASWPLNSIARYWPTRSQRPSLRR